MAEQVDVTINITTTENPALSNIESATEGIVEAADKATESFEELGSATGDVSKEMGKMRGILGPIKGLVSQLTGGISDGFFQAYKAIQSASFGLKGFKLALAATGIGAAIAAIGFLVEAFVKSKQKAKELEEAIKNLNEQFKLSNASIIANAQSVYGLSDAYKAGTISQSQYIAGLAELGINIDENNLKTAEGVKKVNELAAASGMLKNIQAQRAEQEGLLAEAVKQGNAQQITAIQSQINALDLTIAQVAGRKKEILDFFEEQKKIDDKFKAELVNIPAYYNSIREEAETLLEVLFGGKEGLGKQIEKFGENVSGSVQKQVRVVGEAYANNASTFADHLKNLNANTTAFYEGEQGKAIKGALSTAAEFTKVLADAQDVSSSAAFEGAKKYKIASVVTSAIQSSFEAYGSAQQFGPVLGPILGAAQVAAIALASNKAINDIKNSSFSSPSLPSTTTPAQGRSLQTNFNIVGTSGINQLAQGIGGQFQQPLRAYVVGSDVMGYDELQRRRIRTATFG